MKKPASSPVNKVGSWECPDKMFFASYPTLSAYMCDAFWDDKKPRELSTISVNFSQGCVNMGISDHALQRSAYTTAQSLTEALELLEEALAMDKVKWRAWKAGKGR